MAERERWMPWDVLTFHTLPKLSLVELASARCVSREWKSAAAAALRTREHLDGAELTSHDHLRDLITLLDREKQPWRAMRSLVLRGGVVRGPLLADTLRALRAPRLASITLESRQLLNDDVKLLSAHAGTALTSVDLGGCQKVSTPRARLIAAPAERKQSSVF